MLKASIGYRSPWSATPARCYIRWRRLSFVGHLCRADTCQDQSRALQAFIRDLSKDCRGRTGRQKQTYWERLRMICARSVSAWRRQGGALWIGRHGDNSWRRLRLYLTCSGKREYASRKSADFMKLRSRENQWFNFLTIVHNSESCVVDNMCGWGHRFLPRDAQSCTTEWGKKTTRFSLQ